MISHNLRVSGRLAWMSLIIGFSLCLVADTAAQQTAADIPVWFDMTSTPPNTKINTDLTFQLQNEESLVVDPTNPNNLVVVWRDFRLGYRQVGWAWSHDGGTTWTEGGLIPTTPYDRDSDPVITANSDGYFYASILTFSSTSSANGLHVLVSLDSGMTWPFDIPGVDHPPEFPTNIFEDKQWITCDLTGGPTDGNLYMPWARFTNTSQIWFVRSTIGGAFEPEVPISDQTNVQWPVPAVGADGRVIVAWGSYTQSRIMYDISYDEGATWGTDRILQDVDQVDRTINGNIRTFSFPAMIGDMTQSPYRGRIYCAFADRAADGLLDLYLTRSLDSGETWLPRVRINDDPLGNGIDQFHPWIAINDDGVVTLAFYDRRLDPVNNLLFDLWITHSFDGGVTWTPNQRVSEVSSNPFDAVAMATTFKTPVNPQPVNPNEPDEIHTPMAGLIGEYIGLATSRLRATMVFTDTRNGHQDVYAANMPLRLFPPQLVSPADHAVSFGADVQFDWDDYSIYDTGMVYTLEYAPAPDFAAGVTRVDGLTGHAHQILGMPSGLWYWRMRATDVYGDSSVWSAPRELLVPTLCACDCHADPAQCEGVRNVLDVVTTVNVAFKGSTDLPDPNAQCPYTMTDVDCSHFTNVIDVVKMVNVAFKSQDPALEFCNPCGP